MGHTVCTCMNFQKNAFKNTLLLSVCNMIRRIVLFHRARDELSAVGTNTMTGSTNVWWRSLLSTVFLRSLTNSTMVRVHFNIVNIDQTPRLLFFSLHILVQLLYSGKLLRRKLLQILRWLFVKFSLWNLGAWGPLARHEQAICENRIFLHENHIFHHFTEVFSSKVSHYTILFEGDVYFLWKA